MTTHTNEHTLKTLPEGGLFYESETDGVWTAVDFDGTLVEFDTWLGFEHIGPPIPAMVNRVKTWIQEGRRIKIFTARVNDILQFIEHKNLMIGSYWDKDLYKKVCADRVARKVIKDWSLEYLGCELPITNQKDYLLREIWDDIAIQIIPNTGETIVSPEQSEYLANKGGTPNISESL